MTVVLRPVGLSDLDLICRFRKAMFLAAGDEKSAQAAMSPAYRDWQDKALRSGVYFGFIAQKDEQPVGGVGLWCLICRRTRSTRLSPCAAMCSISLWTSCTGGRELPAP